MFNLRFILPIKKICEVLHISNIFLYLCSRSGVYGKIRIINSHLIKLGPMKKIYTILATLLLVVASSFATTVTYDFESGDTDWYFVQTKQSNAWVRSTAAGSASTGNYALHVSSGDNTYGYTNNYLSTSWVYGKLVTLTAESTISFSWKGYGEVNYDYMLVYLFLIGAFPTAGSESVPSGAIQLGAEFSGKTDWQTLVIHQK